MQEVVILDINGTLNEAQQPITLCMQQKLQALARRHQVYFVTGSTYTEAVDQLNSSIAMYCGVFCLDAEELRSMRGKLIWCDGVSFCTNKSRAAKYINSFGRKFVFIGNNPSVKKYCDDHPENIFLTSNGTIDTMKVLDNFLG